MKVNTGGEIKIEFAQHTISSSNTSHSLPSSDSARALGSAPLSALFHERTGNKEIVGHAKRGTERRNTY
jgi:hypothetical protein